MCLGHYSVSQLCFTIMMLGVVTGNEASEWNTSWLSSIADARAQKGQT